MTKDGIIFLLSLLLICAIAYAIYYFVLWSRATKVEVFKITFKQPRISDADKRLTFWAKVGDALEKNEYEEAHTFVYASSKEEAIEVFKHFKSSHWLRLLQDLEANHIDSYRTKKKFKEVKVGNQFKGK